MRRAVGVTMVVGLVAGLAACGGGAGPSTSEATGTTAVVTVPVSTTSAPATTTAADSTTTSLPPPPTTAAPSTTATAVPDMWDRLLAWGGEGLGDSYYPTLGSAGYDVQSYLIQMEFDPSTKEVSGMATIDAVAVADLDVFSLDFFGLETLGVRVNDTAADFQQVMEELVIDPIQDLGAGEQMTVVVAYQGMFASRPAMAISGYMVGGHWSVDGETFFVLNEPDGSAAWAPFNDHPLDKALVNVEITVPAGLTAVSGGRLVERRDDGESSFFSWSLEFPVAPYLIPLAIGPYESRAEPDSHGLEIITWYPEGLDTSLLEAFSRQSRHVSFMEELFGPYPFETLGGLVVNAGVGLALEHQTLPTYDISATAESIIVHEIAHQWFGNSVSVADWGDIWLNEGPATLAEWLWEEETRGVAAYDRIVAQNYGYFSGAMFAGEGVSAREAARAAARRHPPPGRPHPDDLFNYSVYGKGALALAALRDDLGDDDFFGLLRNWHDTHRYGNASTADFLSLVERTGGTEARSLVESWIYDPLPPAMPGRGLYPLEQETTGGDA